MTIPNLLKMVETSPNGQKTQWEKEKLLLISNFSFSHSVFKSLLLQTGKNQGFFGKGLNIFIPIFHNRLSDIYVSGSKILITDLHCLFTDILKKISVFQIIFVKCKKQHLQSLLQNYVCQHITFFIETSPHRQIVRNQRICSMCTLNEVEDEYHFLLICQVYDQLRHMYFKKYYYNKLSMLKLMQLLNCENVNVLNAFVFV